MCTEGATFGYTIKRGKYFLWQCGLLLVTVKSGNNTVWQECWAPHVWTVWFRLLLYGSVWYIHCKSQWAWVSAVSQEHGDPFLVLPEWNSCNLGVSLIVEERSTSWLRGCYENFARETKVVNCTNVFLLPSRRDETRIPELHSSHGLECMCVDVEMWYFYLCFLWFFFFNHCNIFL